MKEASKSNTTPVRAKTKYKIHWHVLFTHFPISFIVASAGFMVLHLLIDDACYETAAYIALIAGTVIIIPTMLSGWFTWKGRYKGLRGKIFLSKIRISVAMAALCLFLVLWRTFAPPTLYTFWHYIYAAGVLLLLMGAMAEGYYGGRLNHR